MFIFLTSAKNFRTNRWIGSPTLNRLGVYGARKRLADWCAYVRRVLIGWSLPEVNKQAFDAQGYLALPNFLSQADFDQVRQELSDAALPFIEMCQPPALTHRANLDAKTCAGRYPALGRLIAHPELLRSLRYAAGCSGTPIAAMQIIRSDGLGQGHDPQTDWHSDTFHSLAKAWLFLHDVGAQQGPFAYAAGSHRPTAAHQQFNHAQSMSAASSANAMHSSGSFRTDEAGLHTMGYQDLFLAAVPGNTLVIADTSGFHRRTPSPGPTVRIEVYFTLRRNPFFAGLVPSVLSLPFVRSRWAGWAYRYYEYALAKGKHDWVPRGVRPLHEDERSLLQTPR
jgi:Phytanoyl-CoA dioxygenase (PhyH)